MRNLPRFEPLNPTIGAEVHGIDLRNELTEEILKTLKDGWAKYLVLFFRDQAITVAELQTFGRHFGQLHIHPEGIDIKGFPGVIPIHTDKNSKVYAGREWHTDVSCDEEPPAASILHMHIVPESGGDTLFANMYSAFDALSEPMKGFLRGLHGFHSGRADYEGYFGRKVEEMRDGKFPEAVHPVVRTHPVTKRSCLFVNQLFTKRIVELDPAESRALLDFLFTHLAEPRFQCRFRWQRNSIAAWDNRCTQHLATWDYYPHTRSGHRVTIAGERPV